MDPQLAWLAIICLSIITGLSVVGAAVVSALVSWKEPQQATNALAGLVEGGNSIRLLSTILVVVAASFLALAGALTEGASALLSSVAGFMLGGIRRREATDKGGDTKLI
jgi:hypothetical protein